MNVIYLLTNVSKSSFPKYYIGSKLECEIIEVFGVPSLVSLKSGKVYYGSSSNKIMQKDMMNKDIFKAEVLEVVSDRNLVRHRELEWLEELNVADSHFFYNLTNNALASFTHNDASALANIFGESYAEVAKSRGSIGKRNLNAKKYGFKDYYDLMVFLANEFAAGETGASIARRIGCENRHFPIVTTKNINLAKLLSEDPNDYIEQVEDYYFANATIEKIAELLQIETPTAYKAVVLLVSNFEKPDFISLVVAKKLGLSMSEVEHTIAKRVFYGESLAAVSKSLGIDRRSSTKYFIRFFKRRFEPNEFERI